MATDACGFEGGNEAIRDLWIILGVKRLARR